MTLKIIYNDVSMVQILPLFHLNSSINVYRYVSAFYLPTNVTTRWVQSEFRGQLPGIFNSWPEGLSEIPDDFNDDNAEVIIQLVLHIDEA